MVQSGDRKRRPAVLAGEEAIDAAMRILTAQKSREFLSSIELSTVKEADIQYEGSFANLQDKPENLIQGKLQNEIDESVQSTDDNVN
jgi:hypothetical protein